MKQKFNSQEQKAIKEKVNFLKKYINGTCSLKKIANMNTQRRLRWLEKNKNLIKKYKNLSIVEKAHRILYIEHMKINPKHSIIKKISDKKIVIKSHNFCPYLEACNILNLDTRIICEKVGEPSCKLFLKRIHPSLDFSRNYSKIRPHHDYCEEFIEIVN